MIKQASKGESILILDAMPKRNLDLNYTVFSVDYRGYIVCLLFADCLSVEWMVGKWVTVKINELDALAMANGVRVIVCKPDSVSHSRLYKRIGFGEVDSDGLQRRIVNGHIQR